MRISIHPQKLAFAISLTVALALTGCNSSNSNGDGPAPEGVQFDRMGVAGVNTVFIPSDAKDDYNSGDPLTDDMDYGEAVEATTQALRDAVGSVPGFPAEDLGLATAQVRAIVNPDKVVLDLSAPDGFPNGRKLDDDVIDAALQVTLNRSIVGDGISNDSEFLTTFPYLGKAN
jgi:hypothetical protein